MKIRINKDIIKELKPCISGYENFLKLHGNFDGDITEFLLLKGISAQDKIWVSARLLPRFLVEVFAIDCAVGAADYASAASFSATATAFAADNATYAATATTAATYATYAAAAAAVFFAATERERQLNAIAYLVSGYEEGANQ